MTKSGAIYTDKKREYDKKYREEHRDQIAEQRKRYRAAHAIDIAKGDKDYRARNVGKIAKQKREYRERNKERIRLKDRNWKLGHKEILYAAQLKWIRNNKNKVKAYRAVLHALKADGLTRPDSCSSCHQPIVTEAHHPDYSRPLFVVWLCRDCHVQLHRKMGSYVATERARERAQDPELWD